jgi:hypothetical protein
MKYEGTGGRRKLHSEELHSLYCSTNIIKMIKSGIIRWAGHVPRVRSKINTHRIFSNNPEGRRQLGTPRRK